MYSAEKLIRENLDIPRRCAGRWYHIRSLDKEDLQAEGAVALVKAASSYDSSKGVPFRQWAFLKVKGHITDVVRSHVRREKRTLTGDFARYSSLQTEDGDGDPIYQLADPYADVEDLVLAKEQLDAIKLIPKREAEILLRLAIGETAVEIAEMKGCSEDLIWKLMRRGRGRLKNNANQS